MKVLFDNCTSPVMASTLAGYIAHLGHEAVHVRAWLRHDATDVEWMAAVAADRGEWLVITGDLRLQRLKPEREAFRRHRLRGIALAPSYQRTPMHRICAGLVYQWPRIAEQIERLKAPFLLEMPMGFGAKFRSLPL